MSLEDRKDLVSDRALESLRDELRIHAMLDQPSWVSVHSHHFFDLREKQWRELDAVASRSWEGMLQKQPVRIKILFIVESKSLANKHILLPQFEPIRQAIVYDWIGSQQRKRDRFDIYEQLGLERRLAARIDLEVTGTAAEVMPNAPNIMMPPRNPEWNSASFTEAQNSKGKSKKSDNELRTSVVWRARLALRSAAQALVQSEVDRESRDFALALQYARLQQIASPEREDFDFAKYVVDGFRKVRFTMTIFHPVIVVDSDLWGVSTDDLTPISHARVHLTGVSRYPYFWFDLVRREALERIILEAQRTYEAQALEKGLVPVEPNMGDAEYEIAHP
jgi:hypothetical protein